MSIFRCSYCSIIIKDVNNRKQSLIRLDKKTKKPKYFKANESDVYFCGAECSSKYMRKYYENSLF